VSATLASTADRLRRLAGTLAELKERVRVAVAGEAGKAVGDAVRDLLTAALAGRVVPPPSSDPYRSAYQASARKSWDDDDAYGRDPWADPDDEDDDRRDDGRGQRPTAASTPAPSPARWPTALALAAGVVRWWAARKLPTWAAIGAGVVSGAAALTGGPLARAGLALLAAAADLLPLAGSPPAWPFGPG